MSNCALHDLRNQHWGEKEERYMDWRVMLTTFGIIFLAEMGDKTQIAAMTMAAEKKRPWAVFLGASFALAAGLTGAINSAGIIVTAGLAEIAAGSIAMGLGGYLAAKSDAEHYAKEREREKREVVEIPEEEMREVAQVFHSYGLTHEESAPIVKALSKHPKKWVDFMMRFELGLERPDPKRALVSASTIALSYVAGGLIPLAPYLAAVYIRSMNI